MTTVTDRMLKFKRIIKKPIVANIKFFTDVTFSRIISFAYINSFVIQHL